MSVEHMKDMLGSIFIRKGGEGVYTHLADSMDAAVKNAFLMKVGLNATELPVIFSLREINNWVLLTTERLVWFVAGDRHEIDVKTIQDATIGFKRLDSALKKIETRVLWVTTLEGDEYGIDLEPGRPLSGMWNVLKNLGARNRRKHSDNPVG